MWPRVVEILLACWLGISPFLFPAQPGEEPSSWIEYAAALLLATFGALACTRRWERWRWGSAAIATALMVIGYVRFDPIGQNQLVVGMIVLMTAIVPSRATEPPGKWRARFEDYGD